MSNEAPTIVIGSPGATPGMVNYTRNRMAVLEDAAEQFFGQGELTGFTLFEHHGKGWQMSVRPKGEVGWIVKIIPDEQAKAILAQLEHDPRFIEPRKTLATGKSVLVGASLNGPFFGSNGDAEILLGRMKAAEEVWRACTVAIRSMMPQ